MVRIAELSKEVAKDYREGQKDKLKRTFVSASNAAESKISEFKYYFVEQILNTYVFSERLKPDPGGQKRGRR